ncbi:MAG: type II toxin-antitoxin system VapC family toxin [Bacteroidota bacterium]
MKNYLIDTHILIWALLEDEKLSNKIIKIFESSNNQIYISQISLIEIAIKNKLGKLPNFKYSIISLIEKLNQIEVQIVPIKNEHVNAYDSIELIENHRDPFDRLIIATALFENLPIISADDKFKNYKNIIELVEN